MSFLEGVAAGVAFGVFCPAIARKLKALFVKEASAAKVAIATNAAKKL